jgi:hypothetical protein
MTKLEVRKYFFIYFIVEGFLWLGFAHLVRA